MKHAQLSLFEPTQKLPEGFRYQPEILSSGEERALVSPIAGLPFKEFEFQGFRGKRRIVSFGWRYDFNRGQLQQTEDIPAFLLSLRERAATFAGMSPERLQQVLVTEYSPAPELAGTRTGLYLARWSGFRWCLHVHSGCGESRVSGGSVSPWKPTRAPPTYWQGRRVPNGSTAFRRWNSCAIR